MRGDGFDASEDGTGRGTPLVAHCFDARQSDVIQYGDKAGPLDTDGHTQAVAADMRNGTAGGPAHTIQAAGLGTDRGGNPNAIPHVMQGTAVRRLMPIECERLQGFPDNYTAITWRGKPAADGPRYKSIGNSWAVNCPRWIGERIAFVDSIRIGVAA